MQLRAYHASERDQIPHNQGLYAFYLDLLSPLRIGLVGAGPYSQLQIEQARNSLMGRAKRLLAAVRAMDAAGEVLSGPANGGDHLLLRLAITAKAQVPEALVDRLSSLSDSAFLSFLELARQSALFAHPIYVGITKLQTLSQRYKQHMHDHISGTDSSRFGVRLREAGFDWDDVVFCCAKLDKSIGNASALDEFEKLLQAVTRPLLSHR